MLGYNVFVEPQRNHGNPQCYLEPQSHIELFFFFFVSVVNSLGFSVGLSSPGLPYHCDALESTQINIQTIPFLLLSPLSCI